MGKMKELERHDLLLARQKRHPEIGNTIPHWDPDLASFTVWMGRMRHLLNRVLDGFADWVIRVDHEEDRHLIAPIACAMVIGFILDGLLGVVVGSVASVSTMLLLDLIERRVAEKDSSFYAQWDTSSTHKEAASDELEDHHPDYPLPVGSLDALLDEIKNTPIIPEDEQEVEQRANPIIGYPNPSSYMAVDDLEEPLPGDDADRWDSEDLLFQAETQAEEAACMQALTKIIDDFHVKSEERELFYVHMAPATASLFAWMLNLGTAPHNSDLAQAIQASIHQNGFAKICFNPAAVGQIADFLELGLARHKAGLFNPSDYVLNA